MAAAGWYNAPGEAGMLRYWTGDVWTDHRQPAPSSDPPVATAPAPVAAPSIPMGHFEPQFQTPEPALVPSPTPQFRPDPYSNDAQTVPAQWQSAQNQPSGFHEGVHFGLNLNGIPIGPSALSELPNLSEVRSTFASAERQAADNYRGQPRSTALKGALMSLVVGLVMIVLGAALILYFSGQESVGRGEVKVQGTVVGHTGIGSECAPEVEYQVDGQTYQANSGVGGSCSTAQVDDSVDVIFSAADPAHTGRYDFGNPIEGFILILPILGAVVFVSGLAMFFVRLFRRRSQFAQPAVAP